jgi:hypothetical protein
MNPDPQDCFCLNVHTVHDGEEIAGMISVDENMKRAQKRDAVLNQKFYWR